jgi:tricorn protease
VRFARIGSFLLVLSAVVVTTLARADGIRRITQPAISPDGATIAFSWQGDIWTVARDGGKATRLTVHPAVDTRPKWFPDGSRIVFASNRFGNYNLFSMRADGSDLKRLTYASAATYPSVVSPDGQYVYGSTNAWSRGDIFRVKATGGPLIRLTDHPFESSYLPALSPDGKTVYYNRGSYRETAWQKSNIHSTALPTIWLADNTVPLSDHRRLTPYETTFLSPQISGDGALTYICNENGWPNVWRMRPDGSYSHPLTHHTNGTCRNPSVSRDGRYVVYEFESDVFVLDTTSAIERRIAVEAPDDGRQNEEIPISLTSGATDFAASPDGKRAVFVARGDLFLIPEKGGTTRRLIKSVGLAYQPSWLDPRTVLFTATGVESKRELRSVTVEGLVKPFQTDPSVDLFHPSVSPDGKSVAFQRGDDQILVVPAVGGTPKLVLKGNFRDAMDGPSAISWSPDSRWIAAAVTRGRRTDVVMVQVETGKTVTVAKLVYRPQVATPSTPRFLPNGRGIYFTSPEYGEPDLFIVDLVPQEPTFAEDDLDKIDVPKPAPKTDVRVEVYEPNLDERMRRLTVHGADDAIASADSKLIWTNADGQLVAVNVLTGAPTPVSGFIGATSGMWLGATGSKLYVLQKGKLYDIGVREPGGGPIPFDAEYTVDSRAEEKALFNDIWWAMDRLYYDPQHNGKDWQAIHEKFSQIVPFTYDRRDFYALMGEMMEELDSSHLGSNPPPMEVPDVTPESTAILGIEFDPRVLDARGVYNVSRVIPNSPADNPASQLFVGDRVLTLDGEEPTSQRPLAALLDHKAGRHVVLKVDRDGVEKTVDIRPIPPAALTDLEYDAWVRHERALVDTASNGQFGYVHIRAMDKPSLDLFLRETHTEAEGKKGLIVDCRYNGGGSTAVDMLNTLLKTPWLMRASRGGEAVRLSEDILRGDAVEIPTALLVNSSSFSNAEVMAEGFRALKRGPIVGEKTAGYVIGTGLFSLWDGGSIRMPAIGAYTVSGENLENNGRKPDEVVWFDPNAWMRGRDVQIERAVAALTKSMTPSN